MANLPKVDRLISDYEIEPVCAPDGTLCLVFGELEASIPLGSLDSTIEAVTSSLRAKGDPTGIDPVMLAELVQWKATLTRALALVEKGLAEAVAGPAAGSA
jgi:hypothetical protein